MSEKVYLRNVSGQNFLIPEIYSKAIPADPHRVWAVDKGIVDTSALIQGLVGSGKFVFCDANYRNPNFVQEKPKENRGIRDVNVQKEQNIVDRYTVGKETSLKKEETIDAVFSFGDVEDIISTQPSKSEENLKSQIVMSKNTDKTKTNVWWRGPANDMGGYGKMNRYCLEGLSKKDLHIHLDMHNIPSMRNTIPLSKNLEEMLENKVSMDAASVWAIMPPKFPTRQGKIIYFTMLESSGVHPSFMKKLNNADEIWVPSKFNMDVLQEENLNAELHHIPLGVDTDLYRPLEITSAQKNKFNVKTKGFVFASVFGWSLRKGTDVLLKSYLKTFTKNDDTTLLIVSRLNGSSSVENIKRIRDEISQYIRTFCKDPSNHPHIVHIGVGIPEKEMPILYNMCDCFVLPSRGEGFGLPYVEAGACFPIYTKVWDGERLIPIQNISKLDSIMNHKGDFDLVYNTMKRKYSGEMFKIKFGGYFDTISCTDEHPFLTLEDGNILWKAAKDLKNSDKGLYPIYEPLNEMFVHNRHFLDDDLLYVLGWYAAEGNIRHNNCVEFTLNKNEINFAEKICKIINSKFKVGCASIKTFGKKDNYIRIYVKSVEFSRICHDLIDRGSYFKKVSKKIKHSKESGRKSFIRGYFEGDAHLGKRSIDVVSASKDLLLGIRDILLSLNVCSSLTFRKNTKKASHYALYIGGNDKRCVYDFCNIEYLFDEKRKGGIEKTRIIEIDNKKYVSYDIESIEKENVEDVEVFNFSVKNEQSYIVEGFAVHNCGLPVIATRCGGQLDFLNDDNSYLIDIEGYGMEKQEIKDISSYYEDVPFAVLGSKAINQLSEAMNNVYVNRREARERGEILMNHIKENFSWQNTVDKIYDRLTAK